VLGTFYLRFRAFFERARDGDLADAQYMRGSGATPI
jgi:hypothetical protein